MAKAKGRLASKIEGGQYWFAKEFGRRLFDPTTSALLQPDRLSVTSALDTSRAADFFHTADSDCRDQ
jgi:hypothetical protein